MSLHHVIHMSGFYGQWWHAITHWAGSFVPYVPPR